MRRRSVLAALGAAAGALAGCNTGGREPETVEETATAAPVPTHERRPSGDPPADLSPLGVADAAALDERHRSTLASGPHGFTREAAVLADGDPIRRLRVRFRATADATASHYVFVLEDTERYPAEPLYEYVERWDDGTVYQRSGRTDPEYAVAEGPSFDLATERYRVREPFEAFASARVEPAAGGREVVGTDLRSGYDLAPAQFAAVEPPTRGRLAAVVALDPLYVEGIDLSLRADLADRPVDVEEYVGYERLGSAPERPSWVATAEEEAEA